MTGILAAASSFGASAGAVLNAIQVRGLTSGLKLVLDAGDVDSYPGSGTVWHDISGGDYDFNFAASANDPAFSGSAGGNSASEYMVYDGNDWHTYDSAVETWMSNMHKDNALFSFIAGVYLPANNNNLTVFDTVSAVGFNGVQALGSGASGLIVEIKNASGVARSMTSTGILDDAGNWNFLGAAVDEAGNTATLKVNETNDTGVACSYTSPSTSAGTVMRVGASNAAGVQSASTRLAFVAIWEGVALTSTNLDNLYSDIAAARSYGF